MAVKSTSQIETIGVRTGVLAKDNGLVVRLKELHLNAVVAVNATGSTDRTTEGVVRGWLKKSLEGSGVDVHFIKSSGDVEADLETAKAEALKLNNRCAVVAIGPPA